MDKDNMELALAAMEKVNDNTLPVYSQRHFLIALRHLRAALYHLDYNPKYLKENEI